MSEKKRKISTQQLVVSALLLALAVIFTRVLAVNQLLNKLGLGFAAIALCAMLYGPVWTAIVSALADLIGALLRAAENNDKACDKSCEREPQLAARELSLPINFHSSPSYSELRYYESDNRAGKRCYSAADNLPPHFAVAILEHLQPIPLRG